MSEVLTDVARVENQEIAPDFLDPENYATNQSKVERFKREILPLFLESKDKRAKLEDRWKRYYHVWEGSHDIKYYDGAADLKVRMGRKILDTLVAQTKGSLWPENQLFRVIPNGPLAQERATKIEALLDHDIEQANLRNKLELFLTTGLIYGFAPLKTWWETESTTNYRRVLSQQGKGITFEPTTLYLYEGPRSEVVDPFRFYVWPNTARNVDSARVIFEDMTVSRSWIMNHVRQKKFAEAPVKRSFRAMEVPDDNRDIDSMRDARIHHQGYTTTDERPVKDDTVRVLEVWFKWDLYGKDREVHCKATIIGDEVIELRQNPYLYRKTFHPYDVWTVVDLIDNVYGQGKLSQVEDLQYALDALLNQAIDALNFQVNPIIIFNEMDVDEDTLQVTPRAKWRTRGQSARVSDAFDIVRPPDFSSVAFQGASQILGLFQDLGGAPPILQGKTGNKELTATEASVLAQGAGSFTTAMAAKIENQVLSPLLRRYYFLEEQFRSAASLARIANQLPEEVAAQDIIGDYTLRWEVSAGAAQSMQLEAVNGGMTAQPTGEGTMDLTSLTGLMGGQGGS